MRLLRLGIYVLAVRSIRIGCLKIIILLSVLLAEKAKQTTFSWCYRWISLRGVWVPEQAAQQAQDKEDDQGSKDPPSYSVKEGFFLTDLIVILVEIAGLSVFLLDTEI